MKHGARSVMIWSAISGILLVLYFIWMAKLLPVTAWMRFFKMIRHAHSQKCSVLVWGAWRCTSTSSLASTVTHFIYHCITVVSLWEQGEKQISYIICQATRIVVQYSARDHSELNTSLFQGGYKLRYRQMVAQLHINKEMCIFHSCVRYFCPSPLHSAKLISLGWVDKLCRNVSL